MLRDSAALPGTLLQARMRLNTSSRRARASQVPVSASSAATTAGNWASKIASRSLSNSGSVQPLGVNRSQIASAMRAKEHQRASPVDSASSRQAFASSGSRSGGSCWMPCSASRCRLVDFNWLYSKIFVCDKGRVWHVEFSEHVCPSVGPRDHGDDTDNLGARVDHFVVRVED